MFYFSYDVRNLCVWNFIQLMVHISRILVHQRRSTLRNAECESVNLSRFQWKSQNIVSQFYNSKFESRNINILLVYKWKEVFLLEAHTSHESHIFTHDVELLLLLLLLPWMGRWYVFLRFSFISSFIYLFCCSCCGSLFVWGKEVKESYEMSCGRASININISKISNGTIFDPINWCA